MPIAIIADYPEEEDCAHQSATGAGSMGGVSTSTSASVCPTSSATPSDVVRAQRETDGRCENCGLQTHEMHVDPLTWAFVKVPLTIEQEVHRGRCLFCNPLDSVQLLSHEAACAAASSSATIGVYLAGMERPNETTTWDASFDGSTQGPAKRKGIRQTPLHQHSPLLYHDISDPLVVEALAILHNASFDIFDILAAMNRVPHNLVVQERGCERLWILSWEEENACAIGRVGGISILCNAMARFPAAAHLQQCAVESLCNLALNDYNRNEICELSGVHLIVQAMTWHPSAAGIQQCGCTALASIASSSNSSFKQVVEQVGGVNAVMAVACNFCDEESVIQAVYDAFTAMGYDSNGRTTPSVEELVATEECRNIVCMGL
jgi:hypothetical protein